MLLRVLVTGNRRRKRSKAGKETGVRVSPAPAHKGWYMNLPQFQNEPDYASKIKEAQLKYNEFKDDHGTLATKFFHWKKLKKVKEAQLAFINLHIAALEGLLLANFENQEITSIKNEDGTTIFKKSTAYPVVKDKKKLFAWIKAHKAVHLLGVAHQSLKAFVNERLQNGEAPPPGVECFLKDSIGHRGGVQNLGKNTYGGEDD